MPAPMPSNLVVALQIVTLAALSGCNGAEVRLLDFEAPDVEFSVSSDPRPIAFGISDEEVTQGASVASTPPPAANSSADLIREAINACEANSYRRGSIDWTAIRARADTMVAEGKSSDEVIRWVVAQLDDGHSSYLSAAEAAKVRDAGAQGQTPASSGPAMPPPIDPVGRLVEGPRGTKLGYLRVPYLIAMEEGRMTSYASRIAALQRELVDAGAQGWIIDLRRNVGGNQWPMLAALSNILGDGAHGSIVAPDGSRMTWGTSAGAAWINEPTSKVFALDAFAAPETSRLPVALLIDQRTASSGESLVVSFRNRANTRSFGDPTAGKSSANATVTLQDGSILNITASALYDSAGRAFGGPIAPDVVFNLPAPTRETAFPGSDGAPDEVLDAAAAWLGGKIETDAETPDSGKPGTEGQSQADIQRK